MNKTVTVTLSEAQAVTVMAALLAYRKSALNAPNPQLYGAVLEYTKEAFEVVNNSMQLAQVS